MGRADGLAVGEFVASTGADDVGIFVMGANVGEIDGFSVGASEYRFVVWLDGSDLG